MLAVLLLTWGLTVVTTSVSSADSETCHGQPVTIIGSTGGPGIKGTSGDDVIVTNGEGKVDAGGGNDLVCLTGATLHGVVLVEAGAGDDLVDATADQPGLRRIQASLAAGTDTYLGSAVEDVVNAQDDNGTPDAVDTVATGAGADEVVLGRRGVTTLDVISLGDGDDFADFRGRPATTAQLDGGAGVDAVFLSDDSRAPWTIDNRAQTMAVKSARMPTPGFEEFRAFLRHSRSIRFRGGAGGETFEVGTWGLDGDVKATMGGGRDTVYVFGPYVQGTYDGGRGADLFHLFGHLVSDRLMEKSQGGADLARGVVWLGDERPRDHGHAEIRSFSDLLLDDFGDATVIGNRSGNRIAVKACRSTINAGDGDDDVVFTAWAHRACGQVSARRVFAYGEAGDDHLAGGIGRDVLDGGAGRDHADGGPNADTCTAEVRKRC